MFGIVSYKVAYGTTTSTLRLTMKSKKSCNLLRADANGYVRSLTIQTKKDTHFTRVAAIKQISIKKHAVSNPPLQKFGGRTIFFKRYFTYAHAALVHMSQFGRNT